MTYPKKIRQLKSDRQSFAKGLSLIELMIALALSATLIFGVVTVYLNSNQTARLGSSLARIQESGRIAINIMARDIRMVGYQGCSDPSNVDMAIIADNAPTSDFFQTSLRGWEVGGANWADGTEFDNQTIESKAAIGSDVISIQRGELQDIVLTGNMSSTNANVQVSGPDAANFGAGDLVLIGDCENADLFRISSQPGSGTWAHANGVNNGNRLSQAYNESASVMRFTSVVYFVGDTGRTDTHGDAIFALYRQTDDNLDASPSTFTLEELVEGVDSLQILYGERLANDNVRYVPAGTSGLNMGNVIAVKMGLLITHAERAREGLDQLSYELPGQTIVPVGTTGTVFHPADTRIRRTFQTTINMRNRR